MHPTPHPHPKSWSHAALWQVGFRPFFVATCISGALLPLWWVLVYSGQVSWSALDLTPLLSATRWHAHEMFYGYGWALLGGFLLTATKNWVGIRGQHGRTLMVLTGLWLLDRLVMAYGGAWPPLVAYIASPLFLILIVVLLNIDLIRHHGKDSYQDNVYLIISLPIFIVAKLSMMSESIDPAIGTTMTVALFRLAFLVMLERTIPAFMKGAFSVDLTQPSWSKHGIKLIGFALIFTTWLPVPLLSGLCFLLALLLLIRFFKWSPAKALSRVDIGVMYLGYLAIVVNLLLIATTPLFGHWVGVASIHIFTLGAMGLIAPAMIIRISNGHTGRKVQFTGWDKSALYLMMGALVFRVIVPFLMPGSYITELYLTALCWLIAFGIVGWRYTPLLIKPRIDGRLH